MNKALRWTEKKEVRALLASEADASVVSFPKSGRTWLSFMLTHYTAQFLGHAEAANLFDEGRVQDIVPDRRKDFISFVRETRTRERWAPIVKFSHHQRQAVPSTKTKRNVLLIRDPRDVIVSYFHHIVRRGKGRPLLTAGLDPRPTLSSFVHLTDFGFEHILGYLARWTAWAERTETSLLYYEDLVADPEGQFQRFLSAVGFVPEPKLIAEAVAACTFERLSKAESASSRRLAAKPNTRRFRRGIVGGYSDEVSHEDAAWMDEQLAETGIPALARYILR